MFQYDGCPVPGGFGLGWHIRAYIIGARTRGKSRAMTSGRDVKPRRLSKDSIMNATVLI